jgi:hypothetical protein
MSATIPISGVGGVRDENTTNIPLDIPLVENFTFAEDFVF